MSYNRLIRLAGLVGILTGGISILFILGRLARIIPETVDNPRAMITFIFVIFTLIAMYARQYQKVGFLGLLGLILTVTALIYNIAFRYVSAFIVPPLAQFEEAAVAVFSGSINAFIMFIWLLLPVGYILFGFTTFRANVLPRWPAQLIMLGPVINYIGAMDPTISQIGSLLTYIGLTWLSWGLLTSAGESIPAMWRRPVVE